MSIFESLFLIHLCLQFLVEYRIEGLHHPVRDIPKISANYLENGFLLEVIPLLPFQVIKLKQNRSQLFYMIKLIRLMRCLKIFNINLVMKKVK